MFKILFSNLFAADIHLYSLKDLNTKEESELDSELINVSELSKYNKLTAKLPSWYSIVQEEKKQK